MLASMARRKPPRPKWDLGRKVSHWLAQQHADGREPSSPTALARLLSVGQKTVWHWITEGRQPAARTAKKLADAMGVSLDWLTDDEQPWPPRDMEIEAVLRLIPSDQIAVIARILRDPMQRAAWIAAWQATHGPTPPPGATQR